MARRDDDDDRTLGFAVVMVLVVLFAAVLVVVPPIVFFLSPTCDGARWRCKCPRGKKTRCPKTKEKEGKRKTS